MNWPIVDLHCDLLFYLENSGERTPYDLDARCSIPQLNQGRVKLQALPVFTRTDERSVRNGEGQVNIFSSLCKQYPLNFVPYSSSSSIESSPIAILPAFENASGFCGEGEPLREGIKRLHRYIDLVGKPLYISLTWNSENRFGGGAHTPIGLKEDGKQLLNELHQQKIAIDLSHTSDALAYEIIDHIEGASLEIPLMASHSNVRSVARVPRNLPDEIISEVFRRRGIIGFNVIQKFIGETEFDVVKHVAHFLELGGEDFLAVGADFFYAADLQDPHAKNKENFFFDSFKDASCYGKLFELLHRELGLNQTILSKISHQNALAFISSLRS
jgi:microsomal dipeptidase-like Zn-dependent dipeptidase